MGIDIWEVIEAAKTKPFGFQAFYPGPGLGGHCIPIDPFYLTWVARKYGMTTRFIELAGEINTAMPAYVVGGSPMRSTRAASRSRGAGSCLLGMAYKKDVDDPRESPGFELMERFLKKGAIVEYNDPHIPVLPRMRRHPDLCMESRELTEDYLESQRLRGDRDRPFRLSTGRGSSSTRSTSSIREMPRRVSNTSGIES